MSGEFADEFGTFVRSRRKASKLTQRELAELAGVGTRFVSELERGKVSVRLDVANKVLARYAQLPERSAMRVLDAQASVLDSALALIDRSFLPADDKQAYKQLVTDRTARLRLST